MNLTFSRRIAYVGAVLPVIETWRRWHEWGQLAKLPSILDDFVVGIALLAAALVARRDPPVGRVYLAAAWGIACGMIYYSFFGQLVRLGEPDPSGVSSVAVVAVKGVLFALGIAGLVGALRPLPRA
jgi:hypothetical protein